jgi:hypothetical protein
MDDKTKPGSPDHDLVSLSEPYEVRDWCAKFGCSEAQLRDAVESVGNSAPEVGKFLLGKST